MRKSYVFVAVLFSMLVVSGCALTREEVALEYKKQNYEKVSGAEKVRLSVNTNDLRTSKERISCKKNGYGMEMADITATNDVPKLLKDAIEEALVSKGFVVAPGEIQIVADLSKFYNDFKTGFFSGSAAAEISLTIQVKKKDGNVAFVKPVLGVGSLPSIQIMNGSNAKESLELAMVDTVNKIVNDKGFIDSLLALK